jgi:hypothetical protein
MNVYRYQQDIVLNPKEYVMDESDPRFVKTFLDSREIERTFDMSIDDMQKQGIFIQSLTDQIDHLKAHHGKQWLYEGLKRVLWSPPEYSVIYKTLDEFIQSECYEGSPGHPVGYGGLNFEGKEALASYLKEDIPKSMAAKREAVQEKLFPLLQSALTGKISIAYKFQSGIDREGRCEYSVALFGKGEDAIITASEYRRKIASLEASYGEFEIFNPTVDKPVILDLERVVSKSTHRNTDRAESEFQR